MGPLLPPIPIQPRWDHQTTGQLFFEIESKEHLSARTRWSDTTNRKLETLLNDVIVGLVAYAAARKERRAEQKRREQEWKLERQRQEEARARAELEKARIEFLDRRMKAFEEIARLEQFLKQLPSHSPELDKQPVEPSGEPPRRPKPHPSTHNRGVA